MRRYFLPIGCVTVWAWSSAIPGCAQGHPYDDWFTMSPDQLRARLGAPAQAAEFLDTVVKPVADPRLDRRDDWRSLAESRRRGHGDCDDFAIASAAMLSDDGYSDKILVVGYVRWDRDSRGAPMRRGASHAVHLLEVNGLYGANGQNPWDRFPPQYPSVEDLVRALPARLARWNFYKVIPLGSVDYVNGRGNLFDDLADLWSNTPWVDVAYPPPDPAETADKVEVWGY